MLPPLDTHRLCPPKGRGPDLEKYDNPMKAFCELGIGTVDFRGVHKALKEHGYDGVLCVELDHRPV